jgi:TIGR03009 family protein
MHVRSVASALLGLMIIAVSASAQTHPLRGPEPDQPVKPQFPVLIQRAPQQTVAPQPNPQQPPNAPFTLTPQDEAQVDRVLKLWEERNRGIKTFDCRFKRWIYDLVFSPPEPNEPLKPKFVEVGVLRYQAPDRGLFRLDSSEKEGKEVALDESRAEHWISDGKSIFEFSPAKKQLIEHKVPKELQGKAIADSPLPFLFGAEAQKLKQRYWIRIVTPPTEQNQIWLEAFPRYQQDAANWHHALFVVSTQKMEPYALKITQPNEKDYTAYQFFEIVVNDPLRLFKGDPFRAYTPLGWQRVVEPAPSAAQARRQPEDGQR